MPTDFPNKGDDKKVSLRNSEYPQFDRAWAEALKEEFPEIWDAGGNIRGNEAFELWGRARDGDEAEAVLDWIREREAWAARHYENGEQFTGSDPAEPVLSNIAGVVAWVKWGVIGQLGESKMKEVINTVKKKSPEERMGKRGMIEQFLHDVRRGLLSVLDAVTVKNLRAIKDVDEWDGSASRWPDTESYCNSSLININAASGRDAPEDWLQSHCMLPVRDPGDPPDTFVRQAVFAAVGGRGITAVERPEDVPEEDWNEALTQAANTLISVYEEMDEVAPDAVFEVAGAEPPQERAMTLYRVEDQLYDLLMDREMYLWELYQDEQGTYALAIQGKNLFRVPYTVDDATDRVVLTGEPVRVIVNHTPNETEMRTTVYRSGDEWRWLSVSCSSVINRENEIDSTALFDSFAKNVEKYGYPYRTFFHLGEQFRTGQCDFVARYGDLLITAGQYDDSDLARREIEARQKNPDAWGESIQYMALAKPEVLRVNDVDIPVFRDGYLIEISNLPQAHASARFTKTTEVDMSKKRMNKQQWASFVALFDGDEEQAEGWLSENADGVLREIKEKGLISRGADPEEQQQEDGQTQTGDPIVENLTQLITRVNELGEEGEAVAEALEGLHQSIQEYGERIKALEDIEAERFRAYERDLPGGINPRRDYSLPVTRPRTRNQDDDEDEGHEPEETLAEKAERIKAEKLGKK